jgi:hypothetical protein
MPLGMTNPGERRTYVLIALRARMERVALYHGLALAGDLCAGYGAVGRRHLEAKTQAALQTESNRPTQPPS